MRELAHIQHADVLTLYDKWKAPICIISDGAYGLGLFPGDPKTVSRIVAWYLPHVRAWSRRATPETTLWFWNTEIGWATVHPLLVENGWEYRALNVWDKGVAHIAGNCNTQTMRKFPVVTEVCAHYVKAARFSGPSGQDFSVNDMQTWLRKEWMRSGLPMYLANKACGVRNAATRKYLTACHLWYYPPVEAFAAMADYVNKHGDAKGRPYFSLDGKTVISASAWEKLRAKFNCPMGVTNVWTEPAVRGYERVKVGSKVLHMNQKPLVLLDRIIRASTDEDDLVWEPFGGLCSVAVAARAAGRRCVSAEILDAFYEASRIRLTGLMP